MVFLTLHQIIYKMIRSEKKLKDLASLLNERTNTLIAEAIEIA